jgi:2-polyprenyl-3-methyl-5-hydroxy-6-metoxy-1,4-benzoquinol methylase
LSERREVQQATKSVKDQRFGFGKNWQSFLSKINDERINEAIRSLQEMLQTESLEGHTFLDVGSGSGLFSLAATKMRASQVFSFDYDQDSVAATQEIKQRYAPNGDHWDVEQGDVLDESYLGSLGQWDFVYAWGVLHHTGNMWQALANVAPLVKPGGKLFIAIYNDQGKKSEYWKKIKATYNRGTIHRLMLLGWFIPSRAIWYFLSDLKHLRDPRGRYREYKKSRGMSLFHDQIDWLGGYPFEVATPEAIISFYEARGFTLTNKKFVTPHGSGNNQFVFQKGMD